MVLAERILQGDIGAAARLMRDIDDGFKSAVEELKVLYPHTGKALILGITGPPSFVLTAEEPAPESSPPIGRR